MENHYLAIDVETANADYSSICQIGLAEFADGQILNTWKTLVNPEQHFDPFFVKIHGIDPSMVNDAPKIDQILEILAEQVSGRRLVHHMPFDRCAVNRASDSFGKPQLEAHWIDSAKIVRRHWKEFAQRGYGLGNISSFLGISYQAHDALEDAIAAGKVVFEAIRQSGKNIQDWQEIILNKPSRHRTSGIKVCYSMEGNPDGPLFGESVVFTGTLSRPRAEMVQIAAEAGCRVQEGISKETTLLVVGFQNDYKLGGYDKSSKQRKAEKMVANGFPIKILSEDDFRWMADL